MFALEAQERFTNWGTTELQRFLERVFLQNVAGSEVQLDDLRAQCSVCLSPREAGSWFGAGGSLSLVMDPW